jgi:hypothetical protein
MLHKVIIDGLASKVQSYVRFNKQGKNPTFATIKRQQLTKTQNIRLQKRKIRSIIFVKYSYTKM